jgi:hypothetical protein
MTHEEAEFAVKSVIDEYGLLDNKLPLMFAGAKQCCPELNAEPHSITRALEAMSNIVDIWYCEVLENDHSEDWVRIQLVRDGKGVVFDFENQTATINGIEANILVISTVWEEVYAAYTSYTSYVAGMS